MQQQNIVIIIYHLLATDDTQHPTLEYFLDFCCQNTLIQNLLAIKNQVLLLGVEGKTELDELIPILKGCLGCVVSCNFFKLWHI